METLSEHYGIPADEQVRDEEWLEYAGRAGLVVLMKDSRIRRNPAERAAVETHEVRCFCISSQSITAEAMAARVLRHLDAIVKACAEPGPFIYAVHEHRLERVL